MLLSGCHFSQNAFTGTSDNLNRRLRSTMQARKKQTDIDRRDFPPNHFLSDADHTDMPYLPD
jgi:hypothetical protein